jgi:hypothetical protein
MPAWSGRFFAVALPGTIFSGIPPLDGVDVFGFFGTVFTPDLLIVILIPAAGNKLCCQLTPRDRDYQRCKF